MGLKQKEIVIERVAMRITKYRKSGSLMPERKQISLNVPISFQFHYLEYRITDTWFVSICSHKTILNKQMTPMLF